MLVLLLELWLVPLFFLLLFYLHVLNINKDQDYLVFKINIRIKQQNLNLN